VPICGCAASPAVFPSARPSSIPDPTLMQCRPTLLWLLPLLLLLRLLAASPLTP
jgi:hypothetical protein